MEYEKKHELTGGVIILLIRKTYRESELTNDSGWRLRMGLSLEIRLNKSCCKASETSGIKVAWSMKSWKYAKNRELTGDKWRDVVILLDNTKNTSEEWIDKYFGAETENGIKYVN